MNLEKITRVVVRFSPWTGNAASAREFLARACSRKAQTSNPNCEISSSIRCARTPSDRRIGCAVRQRAESRPDAIADAAR